MNDDEPSTDYGLSSEIDIIFSEAKEAKKQKSTREPSQTTSLQFASQVRDDKVKALGGDRNDEEENKAKSSEDKLITWAARLELESLSLKEFVTGNMGYIFNQNYEFLTTTCEEMKEKLNLIENEVEGTKNAKNESRFVTLGKAIDNVVEKIAGIENMMKPPSAREKRSQRETLETMVADQVEYALQNNKTIKSITKNTENISHGLEELQKSVETTISTRQQMLEGPDNKQPANSLSSLGECHENAQNASPLVIQEIAPIKQYLKLLLPKIVGLEANYKYLRDDYHKLVSLIEHEVHPNPTQSQYAKSDSRPATMSNATKRLVEGGSLSNTLEAYQKKRRLSDESGI